MDSKATIRWGILGTANITRSSFLPGLRWAEGGVASAVAGRDLGRTRTYAEQNGIERALGGYQQLIEDEAIDAVYNPLPNSLHAEWTMKALQAGKAVLCEKPLCVSAAETLQVLEVARETGRPLWEAFVFPFREQTNRLHEIIRAGLVGEIREVVSSYYFFMRNRQNIRLVPELGGGALYDVGCYPIRLAREVLADRPDAAFATPVWAPEGVDDEMSGILVFPDDRRLLFSCGMTRASDAFAHLVGTEGEIRLTHPFHPRQEDVIEIRSPAGVTSEHVSGSEPTFGPAIRHIHQVLRGETEPLHLAVDEALGNAEAIDMVYASARAAKAV